MRKIWLLVCLGYWAFLTVMLLVPNPAKTVGLEQEPTYPWGEVGIHFTAFTVLAVVVNGSRFPKRPCWRVILFLAAYGIAMESLQAFVPERSVELREYVENILGVLAGSGIYWLVLRLQRPAQVAND